MDSEPFDGRRPRPSVKFPAFTTFIIDYLRGKRNILLFDPRNKFRDTDFKCQKRELPESLFLPYFWRWN